jgi:hypothetical protein
MPPGKRYLCLVRCVFLIGVLFFLLPASANAASVSIEPKKETINLGEKTRLLLKADVEEDSTIQLQVSAFPYRRFVDEGPRRKLTKEISVGPRRNSRYRILLFVDEERVAVSNVRAVFVQPRSRIVSRWNQPYLFSRGWTEVDVYYEPLYKKLPARQKRIYLYTRCGGGPWKLSGQSSLRAVRLRNNLRFDWNVSRAIACRGSLKYWNVGMLLFPGTLPSGDEGLGRPALNLKEIKKAVSLLGKKTISPKDMKRFF